MTWLSRVGRAVWGPGRRRGLGAVLYLGLVATMGGVIGPAFVPEPVVHVTVNPRVLATWAGPEESTFQAILARFESQQHVQVTYQTANQDLPLVLEQQLGGGAEPDVAILPQPGELRDLARRGRLVSLDHVVDPTAMRDEAPLWRDHASSGSSLYGVYFKVADKSVVWYRPALFREAGIRSVPRTWQELLADVGTLRAAGLVPFAMCGASGWTLTDWFENLYVQTAGPDAYAKLASHALSWNDPSVTRALGLMAQVFSPGGVAGGVTGMLSTAYPDCVNLAFSRGSRIAMLMEGDFVQNAIEGLDPTLRPGPDGDYDAFPFPAVEGSNGSAVVVGGDVAVMLRRTQQSEKLLAYMATADAGRLWAQHGGFISPHRSVALERYPNVVSQRLAGQVASGSPLVFDMSDEAPPAFGSTVGQGEWADLQQWLSTSDPGSAASLGAVQRRLEADAATYYQLP